MRVCNALYEKKIKIVQAKKYTRTCVWWRCTKRSFLSFPFPFRCFAIFTQNGKEIVGSKYIIIKMNKSNR